MGRKAELRFAADEQAKLVARLIGARAWYDEVNTLLTPEEQKQIRYLWDTLLGNTSWMDAFFQWYNALSD